jgi:solute carrier family 25 oxoglutarate transporter 11
MNFQDFLKSKQNGKNLTLGQKAGCSLAAGAIAGFIANPLDLILVRIQTDSALPPEQQRHYRSVFDAAKRIPREEGVKSLWNGSVPTMSRAMSYNLAMFATYQEAKERLETLLPHNKQAAWFLASAIAGSAVATVSLPFDNAKTKMQKMVRGPDGKYPYKNIFDAMVKEARLNGAGGLWVGLSTYCVRIIPHVMITFIVSEQLKKLLM